MACSNREALDYFIRLQVSKEMVAYLAAKAAEVISCGPAPMPAQLDKSLPPTPPGTPPSAEAFDAAIPSLEEFIVALVTQSHVQVPTLMTSLVYLARLKQRLPPVAKGMRCTAHRIFLASLILAAKNLNDSSPKNKHWARYTYVEGYPNFRFSNTEVNLMEKQLLALLEWDMRVTEDDLFVHFEHFLAPIRAYITRQKDRQRVARAERRVQHQHQHHHHHAVAAAPKQQAPAARMPTPVLLRDYATGKLYESPVSPSPMQIRAHMAARPQASRGMHASSSRLPSRTPSLSPPTRCSSSVSSDSQSDSSAAPSPMDMDRAEHVRIASYENSSAVQIQHPEAAALQPGSKHLPYEITPDDEHSKPAKKVKTSTNLLTRFIPAHFYGYRPTAAEAV